MAVDYERELNPQQRAAVFHTTGPALVIAGAGTGKTRTLVYRVARLVENGTDPRHILLLTFTRRAAREMLQRASRLLGNDARLSAVSGGTFHSFGHAVLRRHASSLGIARNFTVLDRSDAEDVLNHLRTELGFAGGKGIREGRGNRKRFPQKRTLAEIFSKTVNTQKDIEETLRHDWPQFLSEQENLQMLFEKYRAYKREHALLDYDDLLLDLLRLLTTRPDLSQRLANRFRYIVVDEYQDTNRLQAEILKAAAVHRNIMAVGDDAQAIYSFRGADFRNIREFPRDFPGTTLYTIGENYRATQPLLDAANSVMAQTKQTYEKKLFTARKEGASPRLVGCADEAAQATYLADEILRMREEAIPLEEIAVLFRSSYHSFELEAELARRNIPFVKYGGFRFAEAAHVKDALAHLRWETNPKDLVAAQRCLLLLAGIGPVSARSIAERAASNPDLSEGLGAVVTSPNAKSALEKLREALSRASTKVAPHEKLAVFVRYLEPTIMARFDDFPKRLRDLEHLVHIARRFRSTERFVSDFSIDPPADHTVTGVTGVENEEEPLVLSTIHSAKGLEWRAVFVLSVLDGYLPQDYAFRSPNELEEERRLLYVAMTRAKDFVTLTYPAMVIPHGNAFAALRSEMVFAKPSQFLEGIPDRILPHTILADSVLFDGITYENDVE